MIIQRQYNIFNYLEDKTSILIIGSRGAGKSFWVQQSLAQIPHLNINLLKADTFLEFNQNPAQLRYQIEFAQKKQTDQPIVTFIDEVQKIPLLLDEVHYLIENHKPTPLFVLTGSSARKLKRGHANLTAGRLHTVHLYPFSLFEIDLENPLELLKALQWGLLPKAWLSSSENKRSTYLQDYTHTYLKEEILQEGLIRKLDSFQLFLDLAAQYDGQPINYSKIARYANSTVKSVQSYFEILVDTLLAIEIPPYSFSIKHRMLNASKFYLFDNGVVNALAGNLRSSLKSGTSRYGRLFENFVVNEIWRYNKSQAFHYGIYHFRSSENLEIDLILQRNINSPPVLIEIKSSSSFSNEGQNFKTLHSFSEEFPRAKKMIIAPVKQGLQYDQEIEVWPVKEGIIKAFEYASEDF